ncbi:MAG: CBS domain-containing protein [Phycisphaerae bacterium]
MLLGLMLVAAIAGGHFAHAVYLPRVVGFLLGGLGLKLALEALLGGGEHGAIRLAALREAEVPLRAVKDLALGLILFTIGGVFERARLRAVGVRSARILLCESAAVFVLVTGGSLAICVLTMPSTEGGVYVTLALLLGAAAIATAPAATLAVLQEFDAKGPITDSILGVTGLNNVVCIVLFYTAYLLLSASGMLGASDGAEGWLWWSLGATILGSVALGLILGLIISVIQSKLPLAETLIAFFAMFVLVGEGEKWLAGAGHGLTYNFLLTALTMGAVFFNIAIDAQKLVESLRTIGAPIFAAFFVMAGYGLHVHDLIHMGWLGAGYVVLRLAGKELGGYVGVRWAGGPQRTSGRIGDGLLCQAAVVIGLAAFVQRSWNHPLAQRFSTVVLGSVVVFELIGPLLLKRRVRDGGEVKAITLLRRVVDSDEGPSFLRLALEPILRALGAAGSKSDESPREELCVKHIMRTNVQVIEASATLDEVLHFIERSTHSHFPVVSEDGNLLGVIHFSDVHDVIYDPVMRDLVTAVDLADPKSRVVSPDVTLEKLSRFFSEDDVGVLPVADEEESRKIVGLVEQRDMLRALHDLQDER